MGDRMRRIARIAIACAVIMIFVVSPAIAHAETSSARVRFTQQYRVDASGLPNTFSYRITREDASAPLPIDESGNAIETFSLRRDDDIWLTFAFEEGALMETGTLVYRYKAEPVSKKLEYGLYYVDTLSNDLKAGVNVYFVEIYVMVDEDGNIEEVLPTVHVEGWDGPKVSDPGWRVGWDEDAYFEFLRTNGYASSSMYPSGRTPGRNGGGFSYAQGWPNGAGIPNTSGNTGSSDSASGRDGGNESGDAKTTSNNGSGSSWTGANSGANAAGGTNSGASATGGTNSGANATGGTTSTNGSGASTTRSTNGAGSVRTLGATSGTNATGARNASDGLATTADPTPWGLVLALVASASLLLAMGLVRRSLGNAT